MNKKLILYQYDRCPYCTKVKEYLDSKNITVEMKDTLYEQSNRDELINAGGKLQVPCLIIDGTQPLYESDDIIKWFEENYQ